MSTWKERFEIVDRGELRWMEVGTMNQTRQFLHCFLTLWQCNKTRNWDNLENLLIPFKILWVSVGEGEKVYL